MSKQKQLPGVYCITNRINGKRYIGQSQNINTRFKQYRWAIKSDKSYVETKRPIVQAMRKYGIENFDFDILAAGSKYNDPLLRVDTEIEYIQLYKTSDPNYGYNESEGGELGVFIPRKQKLPERIKRSKSVFLFDTETDRVALYLSGAKGVGESLGYSRTVVSHTNKRGSMLNKRYYVISAKYSDRHKILNALLKEASKERAMARAKKRINNRIDKYRQIVEYIDHVAKDTFGFD